MNRTLLKQVTVHDLSKSHVRGIARLESECFDRPMSEDEVAEYIRKNNTWGVVARSHEGIVGYALYTEKGWKRRIDRVAVSPARWRLGIGSVVLRTVSCVPNIRGAKILAYIPEENLIAQKFFHSCGFLAVPPYLVVSGNPETNHVKMAVQSRR